MEMGKRESEREFSPSTFRLPTGDIVLIRFVALVITLFLISSALIASAQNLLITDYNVSASSAGSFCIGGNYNYSTLGLKETANRGNIRLTYKSFYESLPYAHSFDLIWRASRLEKANYYNASLTDRFKKYIWTDRNFFGSTSLHIDYLKDYKRRSVDLTLGIGAGRFIDVTPLAKAVRIEDFLLFSGQLYDDLPEETMIKLGHIVERQEEYKTLHGDVYKLIWYRDMEDAIRKSGMLKEKKTNAAGILRMDEVLFRERISDRFYGWDVTCGARGELLKSKTSPKRSTLSADITARYSYPLSWRSQINEQLEMNTPVGNEFFKSYKATLISDFSYELTNRIDFALHNLISRERRREEHCVLTHNSLDISFIFYIENYINLIANWQFAKSTDTNLLHNFILTLNYRVF